MTSQPEHMVHDGDGDSVVSREAVIDALRRVLGSVTFTSSKQAREFLSFVVHETLEARGDDLNERKIARLALGRDQEFDARLDPSVRVQANRLRERLARYCLDEGQNDPVQISIPVGHYSAVWSCPRLPGGPTSGQGPTRGPGLAVFLLRSVSAAGLDHRLAVGLSESIVHALTRFPGLRVIGPLEPSGRSATRSDVLDVGPRTGASFALSGRVVEDGDIVRVTVSLADTTTGEVLWSDETDRPSATLTGFAFDDELVERIVGRVGDIHGVVLRHREGAGHPSDNPIVYSAVAGYYVLLQDLDPSKFAPTIEALEHAVDLEPTNPLVLGALARIHSVDVLMRGPVEAAASLARAEARALAAQRIDPYVPEAEAALAVVALARGEIDRCRAHVVRLGELAPHHPSFVYMSGLLTAGCGEWDEGIWLIRRSIDLNPHHPRHYGTLLAIDHFRRGDVAAALGEAMLLGFPGYIWGPMLSAICLNVLGMSDAAGESTKSLLKVAPDFFERPRSWIGSAPAISPEIVDLLVDQVDALRSLV